MILQAVVSICSRLLSFGQYMPFSMENMVSFRMNPIIDIYATLLVLFWQT